MKESNRNPVIRVHPHTRQKLKVKSAERKMTMQDFVEWLVNQEIEREKKGVKNANKDV